MRSSIMVMVIGSTLLAAAGGPVMTAAQAQEVRPSFDCGVTLSGVERAICGDNQLASLDRQISLRFLALINAFDQEAGQALRADQKYFLYARDAAFDNADEESADQQQRLRDDLSERLDFLSKIDPNPPAGLAGVWGQFAGEFDFTPAGGVQAHGAARSAPAFSFAGYAAEPLTGRWVCEVSGTIDGSAVMHVVDPVETEISFVRNAAFLTLTGEDSPQYCGMGGSITGAWFYLGPIQPS